MKRTFVIAFGLIAILAALALADVQVANVVRPDVPDFVGYVPDEFVVKFKPEVGKVSQTQTALGFVAIGNAAIDALSRQYEVAQMREQFPGATPIAVRGEILDLSRYHVIKFESGHKLEDVMAEFRNNPMVESVEPIGIHALYATPNDGFYDPEQWHLNQASNDKDIDAPEAWDIESGDPGVIVAVMDSGVRYYHKDLGGSAASSTTPTAADGNMWINLAEKNGTAGVDDDGNGYVDDWVGYDFVTGLTGCWTGEDCATADNDPRDFNGHGTHCAGNVGAINNNGYASCAAAGGWGNGTLQPTGNGVKVMALRIGYSASYLGQEAGYVRMDFAASAFYYAANKGAKIASCSWGASNSGGIDAAITYFLNAGGMIFKAAGNANNQTSDYMTARTDIIAVAATDQNDCRASFSSYGTWVEISAPGVAILSSYHDHADAANDYVATLDGTSMATPIAASVAALIWSKNPTWTATQVRDQLYATVDPIDGLSCNSSYVGKLGVGRVNAYNAVNTGGGCTAPVANFSGTPTSGSAPLSVTFTNSSTGTAPLTYAWTFGDGGTSTAASPVYSYANPGTYTVTLTATNACGSDGETKTGYITVSTPPAQQCDDFNDNNITNWVNSTGTWTVSGGIVTGNSSTSNSKRTSPFGSFTNPTINCQVRMNTGRTQRNARIIFNYVDANNYRFIEGDDVNNWWRIYSRTSGTNTVRATFTSSVATATWYNVEVVVTSTGNTTLKVNGATLGSYNFGSAPSGLVGIGYNKANCNFDNFCVGASSSLIVAQGETEEVGEPIAKTSPLPTAFELAQNYPNPFNPTTTIKYILTEATNVELVIINVLGERVKTLVSSAQAAGEHSVVWDGRNQSGSQVSSGIYFYKMTAGGATETRKMVMMK